MFRKMVFTPTSLKTRRLWQQGLPAGEARRQSTYKRGNCWAPQWIQMPDCIGIPNSNKDEMHEKGNWKARLIVSEWKSGLEEVVSDCKCTGEGLDGASANSQRHQNCPSYHLLNRGTRIAHHQTRGTRLHITKPEELELSTGYLLGSSPSWGRWCCWQNDHLPIWTLLAFMLPPPYTVRVLLPTKKRYIYGGKQHSKRKRESDKTDSFPLFVIFQFNSVTEDRKAD